MITILLGFCISAVMTKCVICICKRFHLVCRPQRDRWNDREVALHGGIGVAVAFCLTVVIMNRPEMPSDNYIVAVFFIVMMFVGLIDDIYCLMPLSKLAVETLIALAAILFGFVLRFSGNIILDYVATLIWIVGMINAVNMFDNIDGATAGTLIISLSWVLIFEAGITEVTRVIVAALCGVLLGFVVYNFNPSKIFLGDSGSLSIGCVVSLIGIKINNLHSDETLNNLILPTFVFFTPILDAVFVVINRKVNGYSAMKGDRGHIAHRLAILLKSEKKPVLILYGYQIVVMSIAYYNNHFLLFTATAMTVIVLLYLTSKTNSCVWPDKINSKQIADKPNHNTI